MILPQWLRRRPLSESYDAIPRPRGSVAQWGPEWWFTPRRFDRRIAHAGERYVLEFPTVPPILFTTSPDDLRVIFKENDGALSFGEGLRRLAPHEALFGREMLEQSDGEGHAAFRRNVAPAFHGEALRGYERGMIAATERRLSDLPVHTPFKFAKFTHVLARDVIISTVFGVVDRERTERLERALMRLDHVFNGPEIAGRFVLAMAMRGWWAPFPKLQNLNAEIDAITYEEIAARRNGKGEGRRDCLALFLEIQAKTQDDSMSDRMIAMWMRMLLIAGWETTAVTVSWVVERLVRHPEALARAQADVAEGTHSYLDAAITEAMRLRPVLPLTVRYVTRPFQLNDISIPKDTLLAVDIERLHRRADLYPDPDTFRPERFLTEKPGTFTWVPFGGGVHRCIGAQFAMFEARIILRTILQSRRLVPDLSPSERPIRQNILLAPKQRALVTMLPVDGGGQLSASPAE